jgi:hypothetical protein
MKDVLDRVVHVVLMERHHGHDAAHHVEQERSEVADERDDQQAVGESFWPWRS